MVAVETAWDGVRREGDDHKENITHSLKELSPS
jgi:hypothetical protein